jgi:hypothetical protein
VEPRHEVAGLDEWADLALAHRWTDGLPVYPPTEEAVAALLGGWGVDPEATLGEVPPRRGIATAEAVAANCVMAGCKPEHAAIVWAALEAVLDPIFNLQGVQTTTHSCEPLTIISGQIVEDLGFWTGEAAFAGGAHANVAIGRAIRLVLWNLGGGYPGEPVRKILGHPGRFAYLLAEDSAASPWPSLAADLGVTDDPGAVTVFACEAPHNVLATLGSDMSPELVLGKVGDVMSALGNNNIYTQGETLVVVPAFLANDWAARGWDKPSVRRALWDLSRRPLSEVRPRSNVRPDTSPQWFWDWLPESVDQSDESSLVPVTNSPDAIHLVVSGARGGRFLAVCPGWGHFGGFAVVRSLSRRR